VTANNEWLFFNYISPNNQIKAIKWRGIKEKKFNAAKNGIPYLFGMNIFNNQKILIIT
jgi:hypothetical protein